MYDPSFRPSIEELQTNVKTLTERINQLEKIVEILKRRLSIFSLELSLSNLLKSTALFSVLDCDKILFICSSDRFLF